MRRMNLVAACLLVCAAVGAVAVPSYGQQSAGSDGDLGLSLFEDIPSVYSASKYDQKITEAPAFVSIVTADEIRRYGYRTLADILRSLPGFYLTYDRVYAYLGARGFSSPGDYNTRLLLLVDGVRLNDSVYDTASLGTEFLLDVELIDRVEIVRGPASSLYGSNALFGVINVITKRGRDFQGMEVSGEIGSLETYKARLSYGRRLSGGLEFLVSGTYFESRGDDSLYFPEFDDPETNDGIFEDNDDDQFYQLFGRASWGDFDLEGAYGSRQKGMPTAAYETVFNDPATELGDTEYFISLAYRRPWGGWDTSALAYYASLPYWGDYSYDYSEEEDEEPYIVINRDESDAKWWGLEAQATRTLFGSHTLTAGGELRDNFRQNQKNYDDDVYLDSEISSFFWSVFLQDAWSITGDLTLSLGLRYDDIEEYDGEWSPRVALIYSPFAATTLKLLYGESFRVPNAYEQYGGDGGETQKAALSLEPETIRTLEGVWEQQLTEHLRGTAAAFYYQMDDLIELVTDPEDDLLVFRNVGDVEARGIELQLEGRWPDAVEGRLSYTYQDAENRDTGEPLINSPDHLVKLNVIVPVIRERLFAGAELQYTSERLTKSGADTDDAFLTNLTLEHHTVPNRLQISASVYNLFDEKIEHPASDELLQEVVEQDGRTVRLKVTLAF